MKINYRDSKFITHKGKPPVNAVYRKPEISDFEGNPLLEALPPLWSTQQVMRLLNRQLGFDLSETLLPDKVRFLKIQKALTFFVPLDVHLDLEESFASIIRMGYLSRNPYLKEYWKKINKVFETFDQYADQYQSDDDPSWTASGFNIVGISGVGKSRSVIRILNLYPQVIRHTKYQNKLFTESQLVWLKIECPRDGSLRDLCLSFFHSVDCILGTIYLESYSKGAKTIDDLLLSMEVIASNHFLGVLVIDEIQRLSSAKSGGAESMLNFFVKLINSIGVPVVLIGTYKAISVLSGEFSQIRRGTGQGDVVWHRMENDAQWELFVKTMWKYQYTKDRVKLTDKLKNALYDESQGITDFAIKLFYFAQKRAIESKVEKVTVGIIRAVAKDKLNIPRKILNALKSGAIGDLISFEDIYPKNFDEGFLVSTLKKTDSSENGTEIPDEENKNVISISVELTPSSESTNGQKSLKQINSKNKFKNHEYGFRPDQLSNFKNVKAKMVNLIAESDKNESQENYDILKNNGFMRPSNEFYTY